MDQQLVKNVHHYLEIVSAHVQVVLLKKQAPEAVEAMEVSM
jgi:hypothetical protein